jgi:putative transposase
MTAWKAEHSSACEPRFQAPVGVRPGSGRHAGQRSISPSGPVEIHRLRRALLQHMGSSEGGDEVVCRDGKTFAEDAMVLALGITTTGEKRLLGFVQTGTETEKVCAAFLRALVERGLRYEQGLLCIMDGSKGLRKAVASVFGARAVVQRCQWHKRENVVAYLPKGQQALWRRKLQAAYERPSYAEAKAALLRCRQELRLLNESAVTSLDEGFEETLTLHRLGVFGALGTSLETTNCLESLNALVGQRTDKVDHWRTSDQKHRWLAAALLDIEPRLWRIRGYGSLPLLRIALQTEIRGKEGRAEHRAA